MKRILLAGLIALASCDFVEQDVGSSGGFIEQSYFDHLFPAVTTQQRFDRYLLSFSVLAPLALETAGDAQQATAAINRVNATYGSLVNLLKAANSCTVGQDCESTSVKAGEPNAYAFESAVYEVQSDLYFLAKELILNLDLKESATDLAALDITSLLALSRRFTELFPVARRGAATYRDSVVLLADTVRASCDAQDLSTGAQQACDSLKAQIAGRYASGTEIGGALDIKTLLNSAKRAANGHPWRMNAQQRRSAIYHIDKACARAFDFQKVENDEAETYLNCGTKDGNDDILAKNREALWKMFGEAS